MPVAVFDEPFLAENQVERIREYRGLDSAPFLRGDSDDDVWRLIARLLGYLRLELEVSAGIE